MRRGSRLRYVHHTRSLPARMGTQLRRYTLAVEYARQGKDWETELRQRAKEVTLMKELGLGGFFGLTTPHLPHRGICLHIRRLRETDVAGIVARVRTLVIASPKGYHGVQY